MWLFMSSLTHETPAIHEKIRPFDYGEVNVRDAAVGFWLR